MKKIIASLIAVALTVFGLCGIATISPVYAVTVKCPNGEPAANNDISKCSDLEGIAGNDGDTLMTTVKDVINIILGIVGLVAVIMIIIGGINFIISQGEAAKVTKARNTILYGVIGLFVALLAFAIVNFVLSNVFN